MIRRRLWISLVGIVTVTIVLLAVNLIAGNEPVLGLDLQGGISVVLSAEEGATADDLDGIRDLIRDELEDRGIAEPDVRVEGENVIVDLPGVRDQREALDAVDVAGIVQLRPLMSAVHRRRSRRPRARRRTGVGGADRHVAGVGDAGRRRRPGRRRRTTTAATPSGFRRAGAGDTSDAGDERAAGVVDADGVDGATGVDPNRPDDDDAAAARTGRRQPGDDLPADALRPAAAADRRHDHRAARQPTA